MKLVRSKYVLALCLLGCLLYLGACGGADCPVPVAYKSFSWIVKNSSQDTLVLRYYHTDSGNKILGFDTVLVGKDLTLSKQWTEVSLNQADQQLLFGNVDSLDINYARSTKGLVSDSIVIKFVTNAKCMPHRFSNVHTLLPRNLFYLSNYSLEADQGYYSVKATFSVTDSDILRSTASCP